MERKGKGKRVRKRSERSLECDWDWLRGLDGLGPDGFWDRQALD